MNWLQTNDYLIGYVNRYQFQNEKCAMFDMDDTLTVKYENNDAYTTIEMFDDSIIAKLNKYKTDGYNIIIVSNHKSIGKGDIPVDSFKNRINNLHDIIKLDFTIYAAITESKYRKPNIAFWDEFIKGNKSDSFYCGDAAGLQKRKINGKQIKKDFSDTDLKFAINIPIKFVHRDEFIYNIDYSKNKYTVDYPDIRSIRRDKYPDFIPAVKEMVINVGFPASGKSFYTSNYIMPKGYTVINQDTLKTEKKCLTESEKALKINNNVVIDNTNLSPDKRKLYIDLAKKYNYTCRCIHFTTSLDICKHNNMFRSCTNVDVKPVPSIVYNIMKSKYVKPTKEEGFDSIDEMDYVIDESKIDINKYLRYYD